MEGKRLLFQRFASMVVVLFGTLFGLGYAALSYTGGVLDARIILSGVFISAGVMGLSYFLYTGRRQRTRPLLAEMLKLFFALWLVIGVTFIFRVFGEDPPPQAGWAMLLISFLVGWISGTVWLYSLVLMIGIRNNIAAWEVVKFPSAIAYELDRLWRRITGRPVRAFELSYLPTTDDRLDAAAAEAEDRFSEGQVEKQEVRERVEAAEVVRKTELDEAVEKLSARIQQVVDLLEARERQ